MPCKTGGVSPEKMPNSPSKMKECILEDLKFTFEFEELAKAHCNVELGESFARLVDEIRHVDTNIDFEKVSEIASLPGFTC